MENPVITLIKHHADTRGDKTAIIYRDQKITYAELYKNIAAYAHLLKKSGLKDGDRVIISLPDCPQFVYAFLGGIYGGFISVPINSSLDRELVEYILRDSEAKAMFIAPDALAVESESEFLTHKFFTDDDKNGYELDIDSNQPPAEYIEDKLGFMVYTSGSTGFPKGVPHYGKNILPKYLTYANTVLDIKEDDVLFVTAKLFFVYGLLSNHTFALGNGVTCIIMPEKPTFLPIEKNIKAHKPTLLFAVPSLLNMLIKESPDLLKESNIRLIVSAGENLSPSLADEFMDKAGLTVLDGYGCSETATIVIGNYPDNLQKGKTGEPLKGWQFRLTDADGKDVPDGENGVLWAGGPSLMPFYWRDRNTAEKPIEWFCTNDMFVREQGVYNYVGRNNDLFKCEGNWVSPVQVEKVLMNHPAVRECGVTGQVVMGNRRPFAYIILNTGFMPSLALETELFRFCKKYMASATCPVSFTFCGDLPKTATGKIQRFKLSEIKQEA